MIKYVLKKQAPPLPVCTRCCLPAFLAGPGLQTLFFQMPMGERPAPRAEANRQAQHRLIGHHITNDTHRGMLISVSRPSSAARSSLLSSGVSARPEVQKLVYQMPMFTEIPGDRGPREQTQHRSLTLPMPKGRGFWVHRGQPWHPTDIYEISGSYTLSPSV